MDVPLKSEFVSLSFPDTSSREFHSNYVHQKYCFVFLTICVLGNAHTELSKLNHLVPFTHEDLSAKLSNKKKKAQHVTLPASTAHL